MTQLKTGDRVVPGRFEISRNNPGFTGSMECYVGKEGVITQADEVHAAYLVHGWWWPEHALTPVKPKWEPQIGDIVEATNYKIESEMPWVKGRYIGMDDEYYIIKRADATTYHAYINIRPIAPSPEEELREILKDLAFPETRKTLVQFIMDWHNRHKEGEGR